MDKKLRITDDNWIYGSYHRIHYKKDMLYTFFRYVDVHFIWNVGMGSFALQDHLVDRLQERGWISQVEAQRYQEAALQFLSQMETYDTWPIEQVYSQIRQIRRRVLGENVLERDRRQQMMSSSQKIFLATGSGVDQSVKKTALMQEKAAVLMVLWQPEFAAQMTEDIQRALAAGCRVYVLTTTDSGLGLLRQEILESLWSTSAETEAMKGKITYLTMSGRYGETDLSGIAYDEELQKAVDQNQAALLVYGEEGLLHCRNLQVESMVHAIPYGYHAAAMVNQLDGERPCVVYVPCHFDITCWVKMTEKTRLSYWQLWQLWKDHGDGIYDMTVEQLYDSFPQYFLNIYENGQECPEAQQEYPIQVRQGQMAVKQRNLTYSDLRDQAIASYMNQWPGLTYLSMYFAESMEEVPVPWDSQGQQTGILVHGIRMATAEKARIINCDSTMTLRQQLQNDKRMRMSQGAHTLQLCSNFLFFLTPKLAELYNKLREDRPPEQLREKQGHLDYQLYWQDDQRVESFPLYHKAVLAKKRDGSFLLCQYVLGGGRIKITGDEGAEVSLVWSASAVDSLEENQKIQLYTPYLSRDEEGEGMYANTYRALVGADRVNFVIIQNKIHCVRRGDVILPSIGVVVSLDREYGQEVLTILGLTEQEQGYYDVADLSLAITLEGPSQITPEEWQQVEWAYGGGLSLIVDGQSIYGADRLGEMQEALGTKQLTEEGWLSPLSRQTQESALHVLVKHPRTAIGIAENGDLFVLVFSGRTRLSVGADYREMCHIAKILIPDVAAMMNVDGGGSSVLGMALNGHFMELSCPATSMSSCAGMVRRINTVLSLEM